MLVAGGATERWVASELQRVNTVPRLPPGTLEQIPLRLGEWRGREIQLDPRVVRATDTDDHVTRVYARPGSAEAVSLFVGYGVRLRDLSRHRPEVCYTSAGWTLERTTDLALRAADGSRLPVRTYWFSRGGLRTSWVAVLNYFVVDGRPVRDGGSLRWQFWKGTPDTRSVAQVQVACTGATDSEQAMGLVREFAVAAAPVVADRLSESTSEGAAAND
jgi:EpsI family protein